jgi:hypothetical protein
MGGGKGSAQGYWHDALRTFDSFMMEFMEAHIFLGLSKTKKRIIKSESEE